MPCTALHTLTATPLVIERPDYGVKVAWGELSTDMWAQPAVAAERATAGIQKTNTDRVPLGTPFAKSICRGDPNRTSSRFAKCGHWPGRFVISDEVGRAWEEVPSTGHFAW